MQKRVPKPRTPSSDPSKSQKVGRSQPDAERQRRDEQRVNDVDPVGERDSGARSDTPEDEI